jgi:peptidoglycan/xylan/chitin deacetylase (PgdA/CDA1 family)
VTPLMSWAQVKGLAAEGVQFGAHSSSHRRLDALSPEEIVLEAAHSRRVMLEHLGAPVTAFAYPYGGENPIVQHLVGACGFEYGLTTRQGLSRAGDSLLALPRIEVSGEDRLLDLLLKLRD